MTTKCGPCEESGNSLCTGDKANNIWFECGKCTLDSLTLDQVEFILMRNPKAKKDLLRITNDETLVEMAKTVKLVVDEIEDDLVPYNRINNPKQTLPYYYVFRGNL